ncbi:MAG: thioredoxin-disulfide reductase [Planctomycetota bacterium]|nr:thioredoxin-disulfide reductase [Planctomycetota bacterium]
MSDNGSNGIEKVVIIGSGPAGWTAALYAARADLDPLVYEGAPTQQMIPGGQLMFTTDVENYPGYPKGTTGQGMMGDFKEQAVRFGTRVITDDIVKCDFSSRPFTLTSQDNGTVQAQSVIIATGAKAKWLWLDNEQRLATSGGGVSACAVCDGALPVFRDQHLVVVGGGDTAMEEAAFLTKFAGKVTIVHRRDELRASKIMQERAFENPKIEFAWNSTVVDVLGDDIISGVRLKDTQTGEERDMDCKGLFIAIGHEPNTKFLEGKITTDESGYIELPGPPYTMTNIEGVFAVGDVADKVYRQAVTAAGSGCMGALDAERWLAAQGIH